MKSIKKADGVKKMINLTRHTTKTNNYSRIC